MNATKIMNTLQSALARLTETSSKQDLTDSCEIEESLITDLASRYADTAD